MNIGDVVRHFKGGRYVLLHIAKDCNETHHVAVYMSLKNGQVWTRDWSEFQELVVWPDHQRRGRFIVDDPDAT